MCCAFTTNNSNCSSNTLYTGFQYTPVDSIATCVTPQPWSQVANASKSWVKVPNRRFSFRTFPLPSAHCTQAVTLFLCTSIPQQHGYRTSIWFSFCRSALDAWKSETLLRVLLATCEGTGSLCLTASRSYSCSGLFSASVGRSLYAAGLWQHTTTRPHFHPSLSGRRRGDQLV